MINSVSQLNEVFTIGHSDHELNQFIRLLTQHGVSAVADVRSVPYSRWQPQFNREDLKAGLGESGIAYVFLGKELGARSSDPNCYLEGRVQYERLAASELFQSGIKRIIDGSEKLYIALMCAEKEPLDCHRTILVTRHLVAAGVIVNHILSDGSLEPHKNTLNRLKSRHGLMRDNDLFQDSEELEAQAYRAQEASIAYVDTKLAKKSQREHA